MRFLFWLIGLAILAVLLALAAHSPGEVLLVYPPYRIEMPLTLFVIGTMVLCLVAYLLVQIVLLIVRMPRYVRDYRSRRARERGMAEMRDALVAYFGENYRGAEKHAVRAMELGESGDINAIIAALSAHELHENTRRDTYMGKITDSANATAMKQAALASFEPASGTNAQAVPDLSSSAQT